MYSIILELSKVENTIFRYVRPWLIFFTKVEQYTIFWYIRPYQRRINHFLVYSTMTDYFLPRSNNLRYSGIFDLTKLNISYSGIFDIDRLYLARFSNILYFGISDLFFKGRVIYRIPIYSKLARSNIPYSSMFDLDYFFFIKVE